MIAPWGWRMMAIFSVAAPNSTHTFCSRGTNKPNHTQHPAHSCIFRNGPNGLFIIFYYFICTFAGTADTSHYGNWNNETNEWTTKTKIDSKETKLKSINYLDKSMNHLCTHSFFLFLFMHRMAERVAIWHRHTQLSARALTRSHSSTLTRSIGRSLACSRRSIKLIIFSNWMRYCVAHCIHYDVITYYSIERLIWKTTEKTEHKMKWTMNDSSVYCQCQTEIWRTINEWIVINPKDFTLPPDLLCQWCSQCSVMRWQ